MRTLTPVEHGYTLIAKKPKPPPSQPSKVRPVVHKNFNSPNPKSLQKREKLRTQLREIEEKQRKLHEKENETLAKSVEKEVEKRKAVLDKLVKKYNDELSPLATDKHIGFKTLQKVSSRLTSPEILAEAKENPGEDYLSKLPQHIIYEIMQQVDLFEDLVLACVHRSLRSAYLCERKPLNDKKIGYYFYLWTYVPPIIDYNTRAKVKENLLKVGKADVIKVFSEFSAVYEKSFLGFSMLAYSPNKGCLPALIHLWPVLFGKNRGDDRVADRNYAYAIVTNQPLPLIDDFFRAGMEDYNVQELLACLVGELIIHNKFPPDNIKNSVTKFYEKMVAYKHPLASISHKLRPIECGVQQGYVSMRCKSSVSFHIPYKSSLFLKIFPNVKQLPRDHIKQTLGRGRQHFNVKDVTSLKDLVGMRQAIQDFYAFECRILEVTNHGEPLKPTDIFAVLLDANLDCLKGLKKAEDFDERYYRLVTPFSAFGEIFMAAANGGSYSDCWAAAYARVEAWQTLAAIVGVPFEEGIEAIEAEARKCHFLNFKGNGEGPWWQYYGRETGLAVLRPDGKTVVVFAITDSD